MENSFSPGTPCLLPQTPPEPSLLFLLFLLGKGFEQTTLDAVQASCTLFSSSDSALFVLDYINIVLGSKCEHLWLCKAHPGDHVEHGSIWIVGTCIFCTHIEAFRVLVLEPACDLLVRDTINEI